MKQSEREEQVQRFLASCRAFQDEMRKLNTALLKCAGELKKMAKLFGETTKEKGL